MVMLSLVAPDGGKAFPLQCSGSIGSARLLLFPLASATKATPAGHKKKPHPVKGAARMAAR